MEDIGYAFVRSLAWYENCSVNKILSNENYGIGRFFALLRSTNPPRTRTRDRRDSLSLSSPSGKLPEFALENWKADPIKLIIALWGLETYFSVKILVLLPTKLVPSCPNSCCCRKMLGIYHPWYSHSTLIRVYGARKMKIQAMWWRLHTHVGVTRKGREAKPKTRIDSTNTKFLFIASNLAVLPFCNKLLSSTACPSIID